MRDEWTAGDNGEGLHRAPALEARDSPYGKLLEADDLGSVGTDELDHLLKEAPAARRKRIPVEDVPVRTRSDRAENSIRGHAVPHYELVTEFKTRHVSQSVKPILLCVVLLFATGSEAAVEPESSVPSGVADPLSLPGPDGRGPVALLVGGRFGPARTLALDVEGRTLAYGTGAGRVREFGMPGRSSRG